MKRFIFVALTGASIAWPLSAARADVAAGLIIGEPTGISVRINNFPVLGLSFSLHGGSFYVHGDYYFIDRALQYPLRWYLGGGVALVAGHDYAGLDLRVPVGLIFPFDPRFEFFGEIVPGIHIGHDIGPAVAGGIGLRYIF